MHSLPKLILILACLLTACLAHEPDRSEPAQSNDTPAVKTPTVADSEPIEPEVDATEWAPLDFPFALYRQVAAGREATENVVISPVTALLELDAIARESEPDIAEGIAERLGFSGDVEAMHAYFDELTEELRSRRPEDGSYFSSRARYAVDETDDEQLRQALSIDWVSLQARSDAEHQTLGRQLEEVSEGFFDGDALGHNADAGGPTHLRAMLFVGQWLSAGSPHQVSDGEFRRDDGEAVPVRALRWRFSPIAVLDNAVLVEWTFIGSKVSAFFILPNEGTDLAEIEQHLTATFLSKWIGSMTTMQNHIGSFPLIELADQIDLAPVLSEMGFEEVPALNHRFLQPSRFLLDLTGVNGPEPVETSPVGVMNLQYMHREYIRDSFDRPYLFFIYDRPTKTVLLMGRAADP